GLPDTPENRRRCGHTMRLVDAAIRRGDFDYGVFFPRGSRLHLFSPEARPDGLMSFQEYILRWHRLRSPFRSDGTVAKDVDLHPSTWLHDESTIRRHLVPAFGPLSLREVDVTRANEFRRRLVAAGLSGKSVTNLIGTLHKAMADAVAEGFIATNPVLRIRSGRRRRAGARVRAQSDPLTAVEIAQFLATVPVVYRPLYDVWFRLGWRSSEIVAVALPEPGLRPSRDPRRYRPDAALRRDRGRAEDRAARGRLLLRPGHLRPARRDPERQEACRAGRLRVHRLRRAAALAGMAPHAALA